jgi:tRNA threonylcarbamoyl adenosine modification protein YjeE
MTPTNKDIFESKSVRGTEAFGREFAVRLRVGDCVALVGPLGAGKTALVRGIAAGLGVEDGRAVSSPTFVLVQEYAGRVPIYHIDLYRLGNPAAIHADGAPLEAAAAELDALGLSEMLASGVVLIEWAGRAAGALPRPRWQIEIEHAGPRSRRFCVSRVDSPK